MLPLVYDELKKLAAGHLRREGKVRQLDTTALASRQALQLLEESDGPDSPDVANLPNDLADIETERQNFPAALVLAERVQAIADRLGQRFSGEEAARIRVRTLEIAGELRRMLGDDARAEVDLQQALVVVVAEFGDASAEAGEEHYRRAPLRSWRSVSRPGTRM